MFRFHYLLYLWRYGISSLLSSVKEKGASIGPLFNKVLVKTPDSLKIAVRLKDECFYLAMGSTGMYSAGAKALPRIKLPMVLAVIFI